MPSPEPDHISQIKTLDRLEIRPISEATTCRYYSQFIGYLPGVSLLVTPPEQQGKELPLVKGDWVRVRFIVEGGVLSFQTVVRNLYYEPSRYLHLDYPTSLERKNLRQWPRVSVLLPVTVHSPALAGSVDGEVQATIANISVGGALIETPVPLGTLDTPLQITTDLIVADHKRALKLPCVIRNMRVKPDGPNGEALLQHGVQFQIEDEEDHVFLYGYVYEQIFFARTRRML